MKIRRVRAHLNRLDKMEQQLGQPSFHLIFIPEANERIYTIAFLVKKKNLILIMFSYTFLMIDDLKKNWKFKIIYNFSFFVTFRDNFQIHVCTQRIRKFLFYVRIITDYTRPILFSKYSLCKAPLSQRYSINSHIDRNSLNNPP